MKKTNKKDIPKHLRIWPGLSVRDCEQIVEAPEKDCLVAKRYPFWIDKGSISDGRRITILTEKYVYSINEEIRVLHVFEAIAPGYTVYVMGPKPIHGEYIDSRLVTASDGEEVFMVSEDYDGMVLSSPAVDYNYEVTSYTFSQPGTHEIYWKIDNLKSNIITIEITI